MRKGLTIILVMKVVFNFMEPTNTEVKAKIDLNQ